MKAARPIPVRRVPFPTLANSTTAELWWAWRRNARIGWPERRRGPHYWLGYEYALILARLGPAAGSVWVDIGSGVHSVFPVLMADRFSIEVLAVDLHPGVAEQRARRSRAESSGVGIRGRVHPVRADARALPLPDGSVDGFTAVSSLEHVAGVHGDREALREAARVLRPGGVGYLSVPFRAAGSMLELDPVTLKPFQWHYSASTLDDSLIGPSGLHVEERVHYGERLPFYDVARRLPRFLNAARRPWDTLLTAALLHETTDLSRASGVLNVLRKP